MKKWIMMSLVATFALNTQAGVIAWTWGDDKAFDNIVGDITQTYWVENCSPVYFILVLSDSGMDVVNALRENYIYVNDHWEIEPPSFTPSMNGVLGTWTVDLTTFKREDVFYTPDLPSIEAGTSYEVGLFILKNIGSGNSWYTGWSMGEAVAGVDENSTMPIENKIDYWIISNDGYGTNYIPSPAPEPATGLLALTGAAMFLLRRKRK